MTICVPRSARRMSPSLRVQITAASTLTLLAAAAAWSSSVKAQQTAPAPAAPAAPSVAPSVPGKGTNLPPVQIQPKAEPKQVAPQQAKQPVQAPKQEAAPAPKAAPPQPKQQAAPALKAQPKAQPKQAAPAPQPAPPVAVAPASPANALGTYNPALDLRGVTLPPGVVLTTAGPVQGYRALSAMSSTKTATTLEQIPQSIQVVPKSVIEDQVSATPAEAVRNVSGAQWANPLQTPAYESTRLRGFPSERWVDGLSVYYNAGDRDSLVNVERIEVLKGPSAILYGGGTGAPLGGAINIVSKLPTDKAHQEVGVMVGSHKYWQPYFDVNQPLNTAGTVLFRMTGQYTMANSFIELIDTARYSLHPTITLTNKMTTTLTVQADLSNWRQQEYQGLPATGTVAGDFRLRRTMFIGNPDMPDSSSRREAVTATLDHRFDSVWSYHFKARYSQTEFDEHATSLVGGALDDFQANKPLTPGAVALVNFLNGTNLPVDSTWGLAHSRLYQTQREYTVTSNLKAQFEAGPAKNTVLVGTDYSKVADAGIMAAGLSGVTELLNPSFPPYQDPGFLFTDAKNTYVSSGAYAQLQSSFWKRLHLLGAVRIANIEIENADKATKNFDKSDDTKVLPRGGAALEVLPGISVFASYSQGMKANPFVNYKDKPKPEFSEQKEGGLKLDLPFGLSGTLARFDIERKNVPVGDPSSPGLSVAEGQQRSRGYEADLIWQPSVNWQFLASYARIDAELVKEIESTGTPAGNKLVGVPEHSGRLWGNYRFDGALQGWSIGAGVYAASKQYVDLKNEFTTPSYYTVDAKLAYDVKSFSASLAVKNLTGEHYFEPYSYFGGRVAPNDGPTVYGRITVRN